MATTISYLSVFSVSSAASGNTIAVLDSSGTYHIVDGVRVFSNPSHIEGYIDGESIYIDSDGIVSGVDIYTNLTAVMVSTSTTTSKSVYPVTTRSTEDVVVEGVTTVKRAVKSVYKSTDTVANSISSLNTRETIALNAFASLLQKYDPASLNASLIASLSSKAFSSAQSLIDKAIEYRSLYDTDITTYATDVDGVSEDGTAITTALDAIATALASSGSGSSGSSDHSDITTALTSIKTAISGSSSTYGVVTKLQNLVDGLSSLATNTGTKSPFASTISDAIKEAHESAPTFVAPVKVTVPSWGSNNRQTITLNLPSGYQGKTLTLYFVGDNSHPDGNKLIIQNMSLLYDWSVTTPDGDTYTKTGQVLNDSVVPNQVVTATIPECATKVYLVLGYSNYNAILDYTYTQRTYQDINGDDFTAYEKSDNPYSREVCFYYFFFVK